MEALISSKNVPGIKNLVNELVLDSVPLTEAKPAINFLASNLSKLDNNTTLDIAEHVIGALRTRQLQFDEEDTIFKKEMYEVLLAKEDHERAARILESINLEHTNRTVLPTEKADVWLSIAESWFEADDSVNAEKFINKAAHVMHLVREDRTLQLRYKNFQAKILDSKRNFPFAAWEYYSLSNQEELDAGDQLEVLKSAMTCAILSPAGDQKMKLLAALHKDERSRGIDPHFEFLDRFYRSQIIKNRDIVSFEQNNLDDH
jgi:COP9 signalosome complex subunit 4